MKQSVEAAASGAESTKKEGGLSFFFAIMFGAAICLPDPADLGKFMGKIEDQMREVQIRHLLWRRRLVGSQSARDRTAGTLYLVLVEIGGRAHVEISIFLSSVPRGVDAADYMAYSDCTEGDISFLNAFATGRIAVPQGMGDAP